MKRLAFLILALLATSLVAQSPVWDLNQGGKVRPGWDSSTKAFNTWELIPLSTDVEGYTTTYKSKFLSVDRELRDWRGLLAVTLKVDSVAADSLDDDPDSLVFFMAYDLGQGVGWFTGDTMKWTAAVEDSVAELTTKVIVPQRDHGIQWFWSTDPQSGGIQENVPLRRYYILMEAYGDTVGAKIGSAWFWY